MARRDQHRPLGVAAVESNPDLKRYVEESFWFDRVMYAGEMGEVRRYKHKTTGSYLLEKSYTLNKKEEFDQVVENVKQWSRIEHPNVARVLGHTVQEKKAFCSTFYSIDVFVEGYETTLENYVVELTKKNILTSSDSLLTLMANVGEGLTTLKKADIVYSCVSPSHIVVTERNNEIVSAKLIPLPGITESVYEISRRMMISSKQIFVSPELYDRSSQLFKNELSQKFNPYKIDAFCLGLTVLKTGLLDSLNFLYAKQRFDRDQLKEMINVFKDCYEDDGELLCSCLSMLLKVDPAERIDAYQLMLRIRGPEETIEDFEIDELMDRMNTRPSKIEASQIVYKQLENPILKPIPENMAPRVKRQDQFFRAAPNTYAIPNSVHQPKRETISLRELSKGSEQVFSSRSETPDKPSEAARPIKKVVIDLNPGRSKDKVEPGAKSTLRPPAQPRDHGRQASVASGKASEQRSAGNRSQDKTSAANYRPLLQFDTIAFASSRSAKPVGNSKCRMQADDKDQQNKMNQTTGVKKEAAKDVIKSIITKAGELRSSLHKQAVTEPSKPIQKPVFFIGKNNSLFEEVSLQQALKATPSAMSNPSKSQNLHRRSRTAENMADFMTNDPASKPIFQISGPQKSGNLTDLQNKVAQAIRHERENLEPVAKVSPSFIDRVGAPISRIERRDRPAGSRNTVDIKALVSDIKASQRNSRTASQRDTIRRNDSLNGWSTFNKTMPQSSMADNFKPLIMPREEYFGGFHQRALSCKDNNLKASASEKSMMGKSKHVNVILPESLSRPELLSSGNDRVNLVESGTIKNVNPPTSHVVRECIKQFNEASEEIRSRSGSAGVNRKVLVDNNQYGYLKRSEEKTAVKSKVDRRNESQPSRLVMPVYSFVKEQPKKSDLNSITSCSNNDQIMILDDIAGYSSAKITPEYCLPTAKFNSVRDIEGNKPVQTLPYFQSIVDSHQQQPVSTSSKVSSQKEQSGIIKNLSFMENQHTVTFNDERKPYALSDPVEPPRAHPSNHAESSNEQKKYISEFDQEVADMKKTLPLTLMKKAPTSSASRLAAFIDPRQANPLLRNKSMLQTKPSANLLAGTPKSSEGQATLNPGQDISTVVIDSRSASYTDAKSRNDKVSKLHTAAHSYFLGARSGLLTKEESPQDCGGLYKVGSSMSRDMSIREISYHPDWKDRDVSLLPFIERGGVDPLGILTPSGLETRRVSFEVSKEGTKTANNDIRMKTFECDVPDKTRLTRRDTHRIIKSGRDTVRHLTPQRKIKQPERFYEPVNSKIQKSDNKSALEQPMNGRPRAMTDLDDASKLTINLGVLQINFASNGSVNNDPFRMDGTQRTLTKHNNCLTSGIQTEDTRDEPLRQQSSRDQHSKRENFDSIGTVVKREEAAHFESCKMPDEDSQSQADLDTVAKDKGNEADMRRPVDFGVGASLFGKKKPCEATDFAIRRQDDENRGRCF